mgnify:CR=1 FL=1
MRGRWRRRRGRGRAFFFPSSYPRLFRRFRGPRCRPLELGVGGQGIEGEHRRRRRRRRRRSRRRRVPTSRGLDNRSGDRLELLPGPRRQNEMRSQQIVLEGQPGAQALGGARDPDGPSAVGVGGRAPGGEQGGVGVGPEKEEFFVFFVEVFFLRPSARSLLLYQSPSLPRLSKSKLSPREPHEPENQVRCQRRGGEREPVGRQRCLEGGRR